MQNNNTDRVSRLEKELHEERQQKRHLKGVLEFVLKENRLLQERLDATSFSRQPIIRKATGLRRESPLTQ